MPRRMVAKFARKAIGDFYSLMQNERVIKRGYNEYEVLRNYLGFEKGGSSKEIRSQLLSDLENEGPFSQSLGVNSQQREKLLELLEKHKKESFLPQEYLAIGNPPGLEIEETRNLAKRSLGGGRLITYYIFQEYVKGKHLFEVREEELKAHPTIIEKLIVFSLLLKYMKENAHYLIDARPRSVSRTPLEWFRKTPNIMIDFKNKKVFLVDTRTLWPKEEKLPPLGNLLRSLTSHSLGRALRYYLSLEENY